MTLLIPSTPLIRRQNAKKWHLRHPEFVEVTECGQRILNPARKYVRNARLIDCYECLSAATGGAFVR